jgi:hypothetical protein
MTRSHLRLTLLGVALCALAGEAGGPAWGQEVVGRRMFSDQLVVPEPFVEDELSAAAFAASRARNVRDRQPVVTTAVETEIKKRITTELEASLAAALVDVDREHDSRVIGFQNLEVGLKYQFLTDPSREAVASVALTWDVGGTGRAATGAPSFDVLHPALLFGKGFGELAERLRSVAPLAIATFVGAAIPTRASEPNVLEWGAVFEYSLPYLRSIAPTASLPALLTQAVPIVELDFQTGLDRGSGGKTTGTANIGAIWIGRGFQIGLEAVVPINDRTGTTAGARGFIRVELERVFGAWAGRPLFASGGDE